MKVDMCRVLDDSCILVHSDPPAVPTMGFGGNALGLSLLNLRLGRQNWRLDLTIGSELLCMSFV